MKQETLEQAAKKQWGNVHRTGVLGFIEGAKWQQERSYSEEEVLNILSNFNQNSLGYIKQDHRNIMTFSTLEKWF